MLFWVELIDKDKGAVNKIKETVGFGSFNNEL